MRKDRRLQSVEKVFCAAARIKQNFAACRKIHKKSGHVPDFLYFESKKVSREEELFCEKFD